jgi:hypothetical protein
MPVVFPIQKDLKETGALLQLLLNLVYVLYIAIAISSGLMPGGSVYKDHTFNKESAQYIARFFTVQVHEHPQ